MQKKLGILWIILAAVLWGVFPGFTRILYADGIGVMQSVSARAVVAAVIYLVWGLAAKVFRGLSWKDYLFEAFYGCASVLGTYIFYALAIRYLSSAMAAVLLYTAPAFVILFQHFFYKDPITKTKLIALLATFIGSCLVVRIYDFSALKISVIGILFGVLSGIAYSMLTVIGRLAIRRGYTALQNTFVPAITVGIVMAVAVPPWTIPIPSLKDGLCYLAVGIIGSVLPYFFYIKGLSAGVDGGTAIILANIEPVTASVIGVIAFSDTLEWLQVLGIVIVLAGAAIPTRERWGKTF